MPNYLFRGFLVAFIGLTLPGCGGSGASAPAVKNDLAEIGMAYHKFFDKEKRGPKDADEFKSFVEAESKTAFPKLKDGTYVFIYNVGMLDMSPTHEHVLAYHKDVAEQGGYVLMGDASTRNMSADEFKKAKKAQSKGWGS